jgi:hypothetical protein
LSPQPTQSDRPGGPYRKPRVDLYTVLLALALIAVIVGSVFLYLEMDLLYQNKMKEGRAPSPETNRALVAAWPVAAGDPTPPVELLPSA